MIPIGKTFYKKIEKENKIMHENMVFKYPETVLQFVINKRFNLVTFLQRQKPVYGLPVFLH